MGRAEKDFAGFGDRIRKIGDIAAGVFTGGAFLAAAGAAGAAFTAAFGDALDAEALTDRFSAQLGLNAAESERLGRVAGGLYRDAYGESLGEVSGALAALHEEVGGFTELTDEALTSLGAHALDLATVMEEDVGRVARGVGQLVRNDMAPNAEAGFDLIAAAVQRGGNRADDLLDTIEEYSPSFAALGLSGEQALGAVVAGLDAGARNSDLAADAFKEFSIRAIDDSELTRGAFQQLGFDAGAIATRIAEGGPAAQQATSEIIQAIAGIADPIAQEAIGVALFGTQFEDLGIGVIAAMDPAAAALQNTAGAADTLGTTLNDNTAAKIEEFKRRALGGLADYIANGVIPGIQEFIGIVGPELQTVMAETGLSGALSSQGLATATVDAFRSAANFTTDTLIPAFLAVRQFWDDNGPSIIATVRTVRDGIVGAWEAIDTAAEVTGQVVFGVVGFIVNEFYTLAERVVGAAARIVGFFDKDLAQQLRDTQTDIRTTQEEWNDKVDRMTKSVRLDADTAAARWSIDKLLSDYQDRRIRINVDQYATMRYGDGYGVEGPGGGALAATGRMPPAGMGSARQILGIANAMGVTGNASSIFRPGSRTSTGNPSYHGMGRAVDFFGRNLGDIFNRLRAAGVAWRELIYTPAGIRQIRNGMPHIYTGGSVRADHFNHVHAALAEGGIVRRRPGGIIANIGEGRYDEAVVPLPPGARFGMSIGSVVINIVGGDPEATARAVHKELLRIGRANGTTLAGLA